MAESSGSSPGSDGSISSPASRRTQTINIGRWSAAEDERLKEAVAKHGTRWIVVAPEVGTRNSEQCAKRWNDNLNPDLDHSFWSVEEDKLLIHLVSMYGHNWKVMTQGSFRSRSPLSLKNRYSLLMRRQKRQSKRRQQPSASKSDLGMVITPPSGIQTLENISAESTAVSSYLFPAPGPVQASSCYPEGNAALVPFNFDMGCMDDFPTYDFGYCQDSRGALGASHSPPPSAATNSTEEVSTTSHRQEQSITHRGWGRQNFCDNLDLDSFFNGTDMSFPLDGAGNYMADRHRTPVPDKTKDRSLEVSITCSRSRLRAMVCHAFEGALRETRGIPDEEQVTVMMRFKSGKIFSSS